jgi:hypothetical protein
MAIFLLICAISAVAPASVFVLRATLSRRGAGVGMNVGKPFDQPDACFIFDPCAIWLLYDIHGGGWLAATPAAFPIAPPLLQCFQYRFVCVVEEMDLDFAAPGQCEPT